MWEEEELDRAETIDRARLLVLFSEEMELGELAGENAAELAMEEAQAIVEENWHTPSMMKSAAEVGWTGANAPIVRELWGGV